jgi:PPOX class probable F420-dependent enzyme
MSTADPRLAYDYAMTAEEITEFVYEAPRYATVSTLRKDGSPISDGVGIEWDGTFVYTSMRNTRAMCQRLRRDPRMCVHVMNADYPVRWVRWEGEVEIIDDPDYERTFRIMHRYMDATSDAQQLKDFNIAEYEPNYVDQGRTMYRLTVRRLQSYDARKQAARFELSTGRELTEQERSA